MPLLLTSLCSIMTLLLHQLILFRGSVRAPEGGGRANPSSRAFSVFFRVAFEIPEKGVSGVGIIYLLFCTQYTSTKCLQNFFLNPLKNHRVSWLIFCLSVFSALRFFLHSGIFRHLVLSVFWYFRLSVTFGCYLLARIMSAYVLLNNFQSHLILEISYG